MQEMRISGGLRWARLIALAQGLHREINPCYSTKVEIDLGYLQETLLRLLKVHSPTGYTDPVVRLVCQELDALGMRYELTRRGAIRAFMRGKKQSPARALVTHLDTLGAMVKAIKPNGRLAVVPVGTWSARFAEGARVSVFTDDTILRGTILPLKASGHTFDREIDTQPVAWNNLEVRLDERSDSLEALEKLGVHVGDFIGIDSQVEILPNGYINARHLDDKAGVAAMLAAIKALKDQDFAPPFNCQFLFTISEEVGSGASAVVFDDIAEMVTIDNGTVAPGQNGDEHSATVVMADSSGPFDYHLTHHLVHLADNHRIPMNRDIFLHYRCDSASAVDAGNDIRTALIAFGVDASHGYERTHMDALLAISQLTVAYVGSDLLFERQSQRNTLKVFPETRLVDVDAVCQTESDRVVQDTPQPSEAHNPVDDLNVKSTSSKGKNSG